MLNFTFAFNGYLDEENNFKITILNIKLYYRSQINVNYIEKLYAEKLIPYFYWNVAP